MALYSQLPKLLLPWYEENRRTLPWRQNTEPYPVWLSEIMLQQTRVEAVRGYYARFLEALPTIEALAQASEEQCHKLWEGLGYYSRVKNLQKAAQVIMEQYGGKFPTTYDEIRALPGIGDYTAGAICSICFDLPTPAVDGNVVRVLTRLLADDRQKTDLGLRRELTENLQKVYPAGKCGLFTQALMELGATVCLPNGAPHCEVCPLRGLCRAYAQGDPETYPRRGEKKARRVVNMTLLICHAGEEVALRKRPQKGLLAGLWEYPHTEGFLTVEEAISLAESWGLRPLSPVKIVEKTHIFTHVQWNMRGVYMECSAKSADFTWADLQALEETYALPTAFRQFSE